MRSGFTMLMASSMAAIVVACSGDGSRTVDPLQAAGVKRCPIGTAILTVPPIDVGKIMGWVPLGNLAPPGHTFPTDHQYIYLPPVPAGVTLPPVDILAPADVFITRARMTNYSTGNVDYAIEMSPCAEVHVELGHVTALEPSLLAKLGAFNQACQSYTPTPVSTCFTTNLAVPVSAGDKIGTVGGRPGLAGGLDIGMFDSRITPIRFANAARWRSMPDGFDSFHVVAPSEYFVEPVKSQIAAKVGSFDGRVRRTAAPVGGTIEVDVAGTAQGAWFHPTQPVNPESSHFAIVPDNVDPTKIVFSFGTAQPSVTGRMFTIVPATSGAIDRAPSQVTADGQVYCYDTGYFNTVILLRMLDANRLRVEPRAGTTCAREAPFVMTGAAFEYVR